MKLTFEESRADFGLFLAFINSEQVSIQELIRPLSGIAHLSRK